MKRCIAVFCVFVLMITGGGCVGGSHDAYEEIYKRYNHMKSFSAVAEVLVKNGKTENMYVVQQHFSSPDRARMEVLEPKEFSGTGFCSVEKDFRLLSEFGETEVFERSLAAGKNILFISDFFESYFKSEENSVSAEADSGSPVTVLECFLTGKNKNRFMQKLYIDNKTFLPIKMETLNVDKEAVVSVVFREFQRDCEIDESIFN